MKNLWPGMQGNNNASSIKHVVMLFVKAIQGNAAEEFWNPWIMVT